MAGADDWTGQGVRLSHDPRDGLLGVRGGVGGISVQLEELGAGAEKLDVLAAELMAVDTEVGRLGDALCRATGQVQWTADPRIAAVADGQRHIDAVRRRMQDLSEHIRACQRDYQVAEWEADAARFTGMAGVASIPASLSIMAGTGVPDGATMDNLLSALGVNAAAMRRELARYPQIRDVLMGGFKPRPLDVRQVETVYVDLDSSPAGLLERIRSIDARGPGMIEVVAVDNGTERAYVVVVPGTQAAGTRAGGDNPFDEAGIAEAMFYDSAEVSRAVAEALADSGAKDGDKVVLVGYSQGGIHAMNIAADPVIQERYQVPFVLTAGSPVAGITPPETVESLHLEHRADWVPGADGGLNPDTRGRVTVTLDAPAVVGPGEGGLGAGHSLTGYQEGARLAAASTNPSLVHSTAALAGLVGTAGVATATRYSLTRAKDPARAPIQQDPRGRERGLGAR